MSWHTTGGRKPIPVHCTHTYTIELSPRSIRQDHRALSTMNHKENHVARRLGCPNHTELGDEIMCSMSEEASSDEPGTYDIEAETKGLLLRNSATIFGSIAATYFAFIIIYILMTRMWNEDEIKLNILAMLTRIFQALARTFGFWALQTEQAYNEYVSILH